uniref:Uncharacterized protein n=1 Tax=Triticum urartu TaxID=4572 RepID=A0A8R7PAA7_TRIUA
MSPLFLKCRTPERRRAAMGSHDAADSGVTSMAATKRCRKAGASWAVRAARIRSGPVPTGKWSSGRRAQTRRQRR